MLSFELVNCSAFFKARQLNKNGDALLGHFGVGVDGKKTNEKLWMERQ